MKETALLIHSLLSLNCRLYDNKGNDTFSTEDRHPGEAIFPIIKKEGERIRHMLYRNLKNDRDQCQHFVSRTEQNYLGLLHKGKSLIAGPFLTRPVSRELMEEIFKRPDCFGGVPPAHRDFLDYYRSLAILENCQIAGLAQLMKVSGLNPRNRRELKVYSETHIPGYKAAGEEGKLEEEADINVVTERYRQEEIFMNIISRGDREALKALLHKENAFIPLGDRVRGDPLRSSRDMALTLNTLCRVAAARGGLHPRYLHEISERYAIRIEKEPTLADVHKLTSSLISEYCQAVHYRGTFNHSHLVTRAIARIHAGLGEDLSLKATAEKLDTSPSYLAQRFKAETERTYTSFVNEIRIEEASRLLLHSTAHISEIALHVGYGDGNYFTRRFVKSKGLSPTEWRKRYSTGT